MILNGFRRVGDETPEETGHLDWPTITVAVCVYGGWAALTWLHQAAPKAVFPVLGGWLIAWHGSLQHETIHGRPTGSPRLNAMLAYPPLALWLPYERYRRTHIAHHATGELTDPRHDPESRYVPHPHDPLGWARYVSARLQSTLPGRLIIGPCIGVAGFLFGEAAALVRGDPGARRIWIGHGAAVAVILAWLHICGLSLAEYILAFVYPGTALTLLRSFAEHRADPRQERRVAIVEKAPILGLLFLNNNLHVVHHVRPDLAWWRLPRFYAAHRDAILEANGGLAYTGYADVARRFLWRAHDSVIHPACDVVQAAVSPPDYPSPAAAPPASAVRRA